MQTETPTFDRNMGISEINTGLLPLIEHNLPLIARPLSGTARRIQNMHHLVSELSAHEMRADEIATALQYSSSGAGKYIRSLREAGVIELDRHINGTATYLGMAVYRLTPDQERVRIFLAALVAPKRSDGVVQKKKRLALPEKVTEERGRHFHIMADDTYYAIRVSREAAQRDPLVAALFGSANRQAKF